MKRRIRPYPTQWHAWIRTFPLFCLVSNCTSLSTSSLLSSPSPLSSSSVPISLHANAVTATATAPAPATALPFTTTTRSRRRDLQLQDVISDASVRNVQWLSSLLGSASASASASSSSSSSSYDYPGTSNNRMMQPPAPLPPSPRNKERQRILRVAMSQLDRDLNLLERLAGPAPPLSALEALVLAGSVVSSAASPLLLGSRVTEFLAPSLAALIAAVGISAEVVGKTAAANGKEVAAATMQCVAEAEGLLANAERSKAILPLCVGVSTVAASWALLVPVALDAVNSVQVATELYLLCPLVAVLSAATSALCLQETVDYCQRAIGVGNRRFAPSTVVGRTWLSQTEQIQTKSQSTLKRWQSFALSVVPAPLAGSLLLPRAALSTKTIVVAALAAAQSAWFLTQAEYALSKASDAVALKARSSAVCDTYANQASRSSAILPFTSALSGLCAAATAAVVELPLLDALGASGPASALPTLASLHAVPALVLQVALTAAFPALSSLFAAAASVSKARCELDAEAAVLAASTLAIPYDRGSLGGNNSTRSDTRSPPGLLQPLRSVRELIRAVWDKTLVQPARRWIEIYWRLFRRTRKKKGRSNRRKRLRVSPRRA